MAKPQKPAKSEPTTAVSIRTAIASAVVVALAGGLAINSFISSDEASNDPRPQQTTTTRAPNPALIKLDEELSGAVNLSVAFAGSVQILDRDLRAGTIDGRDLAGRAVAFEDQVTQSLTTVSQLTFPPGAEIVRTYATQAMELYQISTRLLQGENGVVTPSYSGLSVRTKLLADRVFDRARLALDLLNYGVPSSVGNRLLEASIIPDFSSDAPDTGINPSASPAPERAMSKSAWLKEVERQAGIITKVIDSIDLQSPADDSKNQLVLTESSNALAISLEPLSLTESARALRLATIIIQQALTAKQIGSLSNSEALLALGQRLWASGAKEAKINVSLN